MFSSYCDTRQKFVFFRFRMSLLSRLSQFLLQTASLTSILCLINDNIFSVSITSGPSMYPTLDFFGIAAIQKVNYTCNPGDIVVATSPINYDESIVKRVTAGPGDLVDLLDGTRITIPRNHVWLKGDGIYSMDSTTYGPVSRNLIKGKVLAQVFY